jgi:hypothetical protein
MNSVPDGQVISAECGGYRIWSGRRAAWLSTLTYMNCTRERHQQRDAVESLLDVGVPVPWSEWVPASRILFNFGKCFIEPVLRDFQMNAISFNTCRNVPRIPSYRKWCRGGVQNKIDNALQERSGWQAYRTPDGFFTARRGSP